MDFDVVDETFLLPLNCYRAIREYSISFRCGYFFPNPITSLSWVQKTSLKSNLKRLVRSSTNCRCKYTVGGEGWKGGVHKRED